MLALPPVPLQLGWHNQIRLGRSDYYVRVDSSDYSVDPNTIGRQVVVTADLERVRVRLDGRIVADHPRVWARQMTVTDPAHVEAARLLANSTVVHEPSSTITSLVISPTTTERSGSTRSTGRSPDGHRQELGTIRTRGQADPLPRRRAESDRGSPKPLPGSPIRLVTPAGPARTTSPPCSNAKSPHATPPAPPSASAGPGSRPARPSTTSTGTTNPQSVNKSPRSPPARCSPRPATSCSSDHPAPAKPTSPPHSA